MSTPGSSPEPASATTNTGPEDPEAVWLRDVYQPDAVNLTVRAVIGGVLIGAVMCLSNIYVFFKTGWSLGVTLTACILAFAVFRFLQAVGLTKTPLGELENNALTTVASGAGYMTAGGNAAAFGALLMITTVEPNKFALVAWFAVIAALGVFTAIPIKRQLINKEGLAFPTGTATAETIKTIHRAAITHSGDRRTRAESRLARARLVVRDLVLHWIVLDWILRLLRVRSTRKSSKLTAAGALVYAALFAGALTMVRDHFKWIVAVWAPPVEIMGHGLVKWTLSIKTELVLFGAGALMSFRTGWSLLLGATVNYAIIAPLLFERGLVKVIDNKPVSYAGIIDWTLWPGAAILVGAGLTSFALDYKSIGRAFSGLGALFDRSKRNAPQEGIGAVEAPEWWFPAGLALLTPAIVVLMYLMFDIPIWAALIAVPLAVLMGFVASRVTGETDVTPTKALGPVTQMVYGAITPGNLTGNIMSANVTGGIGLHAADLLTTLKTGWLLGAKPRHQLYGQLFGVIAGAAIIVPLFYLVVPISELGGDDWPAPSAVVWANVSKAFVGGIDALHDSAQYAIFAGLAFGIGMTLLEKAAPKHLRPYIPSPSAFGLAMVVPFSNSLAMFLGASIAELIRRRVKNLDPYTVPVASGLIAGESLVGIGITIHKSI